MEKITQVKNSFRSLKGHTTRQINAVRSSSVTISSLAREQVPEIGIQLLKDSLMKLSTQYDRLMMKFDELVELVAEEEFKALEKEVNDISDHIDNVKEDALKVLREIQ